MPKDFDLICDLIEAFKSKPCLWDKANHDFKNLHVKQAAYDELLVVMQQHEPAATIQCLKKKIMTTKKGFHTENGKVIKSARSGAGAHEVYVPKLWYYDHLTFLRSSSEAPRMSNMQSDEEEEIIEEEIVEILNHEEYSTTSDNVPGPTQTRKRKHGEPENERTLRKKVMQMVEEWLENRQPSNQFSSQPQSPTFGTFVDTEIRSVPPHMLPYTKKLIMDAIWLGQTNNLNETSRIEKSD
ncbi:uncharacterized protein LOC128298256 [Anopheles moucheti]|uniref:uncharacterized protein LOC128298256 n=1 Tax=Anopheles moucheti TaxID=186751 RepID=UPI0022F10C48|nr:uncharacterized protein LOC128298256 [Anopheles moucheti]